MQLRYGDYLLTTGWGGKGFYDLDMSVGIEAPSTDKTGTTYDYKRPILPPQAVVCGTGSGYEEFIYDDEICLQIVAYMKSTVTLYE